MKRLHPHLYNDTKTNEFGYWWKEGRRARRYFAAFKLDSHRAKMLAGVFFGNDFKKKLESPDYAERLAKIRSQLKKSRFEFRLDIDDQWKWVGNTKLVRTIGDLDREQQRLRWKQRR